MNKLNFIMFKKKTVLKYIYIFFYCYVYFLQKCQALKIKTLKLNFYKNMHVYTKTVNKKKKNDNMA